jgi:hypothetical protein
MATQHMNVMELLGALDSELRRCFTCSDAEYEQILRNVSEGSIPRNVEALREQPQQALILMMQQVESLLRTRTARMMRTLAEERQAAYPPLPPGRVASAGVVVHPPYGFGAVGSLDMSTDPPTPEGLPDWAKTANDEQRMRLTGVQRCSFCAQSRDQVRAMTAGPDGVYICNECVAICVEQMGTDDTP